MKRELPLFVSAQEVQRDIGVSRAKAYQIIRSLNNDLKKHHPKAIIVSGKINRIWYEEACLLRR